MSILKILLLIVTVIPTNSFHLDYKQCFTHETSSFNSWKIGKTDINFITESKMYLFYSHNIYSCFLPNSELICFTSCTGTFTLSSGGNKKNFLVSCDDQRNCTYEFYQKEDIYYSVGSYIMMFILSFFGAIILFMIFVTCLDMWRFTRFSFEDEIVVNPNVELVTQN